MGGVRRRKRKSVSFGVEVGIENKLCCEKLACSPPRGEPRSRFILARPIEIGHHARSNETRASHNTIFLFRG